jgi:predicted nuclease of predicted toxin-antitoxin system
MKILIDMNLSPLWVQFLVAHGVETSHWSTIGEASAPDSEILDYAASNGLSFSLTTLTLACSSQRASRAVQA